MSWFTRKMKGIVTPTKEKKETPDGLWYKTPNGEIIDTKYIVEIIQDLIKNKYPSIISTRIS